MTYRCRKNHESKEQASPHWLKPNPGSKQMKGWSTTKSLRNSRKRFTSSIPMLSSLSMITPASFYTQSAPRLTSRRPHTTHPTLPITFGRVLVPRKNVSTSQIQTRSASPISLLGISPVQPPVKPLTRIRTSTFHVLASHPSMIQGLRHTLLDRKRQVVALDPGTSSRRKSSQSR